MSSESRKARYNVQVLKPSVLHNAVFPLIYEERIMQLQCELLVEDDDGSPVAVAQPLVCMEICINEHGHLYPLAFGNINTVLVSSQHIENMKTHARAHAFGNMAETTYQDYKRRRVAIQNYRNRTLRLA